MENRHLNGCAENLPASQPGELDIWDRGGEELIDFKAVEDELSHHSSTWTTS